MMALIINFLVFQVAWFSAVFGGIGGPLSYYTGSKSGGVVFVGQAAALIALGIGRATLMPILLSLATRYDGASVRVQPAPGWILD